LTEEVLFTGRKNCLAVRSTSIANTRRKFCSSLEAELAKFTSQTDHTRKEEEEEEGTALCKSRQRSIVICSYKETKEERQLQRVYKKDDQGEERGE